VRGTGKRVFAEWLGGFRNARCSSTSGRAGKREWTDWLQERQMLQHVRKTWEKGVGAGIWG
jgi:hypothetical protein